MVRSESIQRATRHDVLRRACLGTRLVYGTFVVLLTVGRLGWAGYFEAVLSDDPVALYRFEEDEGETAEDSAANSTGAQAGLQPARYYGKRQTIPGVPSTAPNKEHRAVQFDPASPAAVVAELSDGFDGSGPFSIEMWVSPGPVGTANGRETQWQCLMVPYDAGATGASADTSWGLWYVPNESGSGGRLRLGSPAHPNDAVDQDGEIPTERFTHVVVTCNPRAEGAPVEWYVNGGPQPGCAASKSFVASIQNGRSWIFGAASYDPARGSAARPFAGALDEVAIYGKLLTLARVQNHYYHAGPIPQFEADIHPILASHCLECHGSNDAEADLDVQSLTAMLRGGKSGPAVVPGKPEQSLLVDLVAHGDMPPGDSGKLSADQVNLLRRWIALGAPTADGTLDLDAMGSSAEMRSRHWAFQELKRPAVPAVSRDASTRRSQIDRQEARGPIDAFILEKLAAHGLDLSPPADRARLARRMYFDALGVPPTPEQVEAFLADASADAVDRLLDALLGSPQYGVRWGRHWLDLVGYTDTITFDSGFGPPEGFTEGKWRYRDYVVRAFNQDKPFDVAVRQQLAGDEMVDWRNAHVYTPEIVEHLTATGFWRCAEDLTGEDRRPFTVWSVVHDNMTQMGFSLMGLTLNCARCHSHKFEPISQQDYYSLMAYLMPALNPQSWKTPQERALPDVSAADRKVIDDWNQQIAQQVQPIQEQLDTVQRPYIRQLREARFAKLDATLRQELWVALETPEAKRTQVQIGRLSENAKIIAVTDDDLRAVYSPEDAQRTSTLQQQIAALNQQRKSYGWIHAMYDVGPAPPTQLLQQGSHEYPRREVPVALLRVLRPPREESRLVEPSASAITGRRLALAQWLTDARSPAGGLVARVLVNRVWERLLGEGLVNPAENLGTSGAVPTHPELLEWLAADFVDHGWSVKHLVRQVMTSAVYQQASFREASQAAALARARTEDPNNRLLWRARLRRVEGEIVRDAVLSASEHLNMTLDGPPVPLEYRPDGYVSEAKRGLNRTSDRWRRSLYLLNRRLYNPTFLTTFDKPMVTGCIGRRDDATVPLQSLAMMNDELVLEHAEHFAARVMREADADPQARVRRAYQIAFARLPSAEEIAWCLDLLEQQSKTLETELALDPNRRELAAFAGLCQTLLSTSEFLYLE